MTRQDILFEPGWTPYRELEIEAGIAMLREIWGGEFSPDYIRGAVEMLRRIIMLPQAMAATPEAKERAEALVKASFSAMELKLLRRAMFDSEQPAAMPSKQEKGE
ncbi:MAG TPA: hypothetical protein PKN85_08315 [Syntrophorhabdaceae bacterium]|nr:hypothetical protein [Syntrophorhabdaceae bacterium]